MTTASGPDDFYEEDEPLEDVLAAFAEGEQGITAPPSGGGAVEVGRFISFTGPISGSTGGRHCNQGVHTAAPVGRPLQPQQG